MSATTEQSFLSPILAGRAAEVEALRHWMAQAQSSNGQMLIVAGEAGIGKSRLLREARTLAQTQGLLVQQGNCFEPDRALPYAPLIDLLRHIPHEQLMNIQHLLPTLLRFAPELGIRFPSVQPAPITSPEQEKQLIVRTWLALLVGEHPAFAHGSHPVQLICFEDLHWCDDLSLEVLLQVARAIRSQPMLLLITYRSTEAPARLIDFIAQLNRERLSHELMLRPLLSEHVAEMVRAIFRQTEPISNAFTATLYERTEGNPFFVEEVLKALVASGDIFFANGIWDRKQINALQVPRSVQVAVAQRTNQLSRVAQHVLTLAAVAGRRFDSTLLQHIAQLGDHELNTVLKELIEAQLVVEEDTNTCMFRHALTQQAIYSQLLLRERKALHQLVAETIEYLYTAEIERHVAGLSWHFVKAEVWLKALTYSRQAGERAQLLYSPRAAAEYYSRAIQAAQNLPALEALQQLQYARANAYEQLGEFSAARLDYEAALAGAKASGDQQAEWQALLGLGFLWASRDYTHAGECFQHALDLAPYLDDSARVAHTLNRVGNWHMNAERPYKAIHYHNEALRLFELIGDQRGRASTYDLLGISHYVAGEYQQSIILYRQAVALFREVQDQAGLLTALTIGSSCGIALIGRTVAPIYVSLAERVRDCEESLRMADQMGLPPVEALGHAWLGFNYAMHGQYRLALSQTHQCLEIAKQIEHHHFICTGHMILGVLYWDIAAWQLAQQHLGQALVLARQTQSVVWQHHTAAFLASTYIQVGALREAEAVLREEWIPTTAMDAVGLRQLWGVYAELLIAQGEPKQALAVIDQLSRSAPVMEGTTPQAIPYLGLLAGEALLALNRPVDALRQLEPALQGAQSAHIPALEWRIAVLMGKVLLAKGRRDAAAAIFAQAKQLVHILASELEAPHAANLIKAATGAMRYVALDSPRRAAKAHYEGLTARERMVAVHIAIGESNREIAEALTLSERTIETHVANILSKLGFTSRAQIAAWAVKKGLSQGQ